MTTVFAEEEPQQFQEDEDEEGMWYNNYREQGVQEYMSHSNSQEA